jgi:hypothetical protein
MERHIVAKGKQQFKAVDKLCFLSKNLYNAALYFIRLEYFSSGRVIRYHELERHLKQSNQVDYRALPNNSSQQTLLLLDKNIKAFLALLKNWKKNPSFLPFSQVKAFAFTMLLRCCYLGVTTLQDRLTYCFLSIIAESNPAFSAAKEYAYLPMERK